MVRPKKDQVEKLKKQDKELEKLPSLDQEKKVFSKGESLLKRLSKKKKVTYDLKQLERSKRKVLKNIKAKVNRKARRPKKRQSG